MSETGISRWFGKPRPLGQLLPLLLAILVSVAVIPIIAVSYIIASDSTARLVGAQADLRLDAVEAAIRRQLDPVEAQLQLARQAVLAGTVDPSNREAWRSFMFGLLAATPQVYGIGYVRLDGSMRRWERGSLREIEEPASNVPLGRQAILDARVGRLSVWADPFVSPVLDDAILNHRVAIEKDGELLGVLSAGIKASDLSPILSKFAEQSTTAFILTEDDRIVAYPGRQAIADKPNLALEPVSKATDPIVRSVWYNPRPLEATRIQRSKGHWTQVEDVFYVYVYRTTSRYSTQPLLVAAAFPSAQTRWVRWAPLVAVGIGAALAALVMFLAWNAGRRLAVPVTSLNAAMSQIESLQFERIDLKELDGAPVKEWRSMAARISRTAGTLSRLGVYVPRALSRRLLAGERDAALPAPRDVTVMFVDVEGFTKFAADHDSESAVRFLSKLYGTIGPLIEKHGGVIDKYTGDGCLAFWGAPDDEPRHASRAVEAAVEIAQAWAGHRPRLRIGLHSGSAIVGEMGFPGRLDYTITGSTPSVADRVQEALKGANSSESVVIGMSEMTAQQAQWKQFDDQALRTREGLAVRVLMHRSPPKS
ncbi:MAG: adenylate/guanylate cyclase domain-containing protein [Ahrensia sp.]|nr:adenylate/guanylate cyclase domain-containing protein [Ahrensia sp.]